MNELVQVMSGKVATTSLHISERFEKRHDHVLSVIDNLRKDLPNFGEMFMETEMPDSFGRMRRTYIMGRNGFSLIAMGFTGSKALKFKLDFIEAFDKMDEYIRSLEKPKSQLELIQMTATEMIKTNERIDVIEDKLNNKMTIDYGQQLAIENAKKKRVEYLWARMQEDGGSELYDTKRKVYGRIGSDLKKVFAVPSYRNIKDADFFEAMNYIAAWRPALV